MNLSKEYIDIYNNYMKYINEIKRECRSIEHMKSRVLKKDRKASEEEIKVLESDKVVDENNELAESKSQNKIYKFSNGDTYKLKFTIESTPPIVLVTVPKAPANKNIIHIDIISA